jgi:medium-chain acyl-[acyl-carrier-protein] hydrolase
VTDSSTEPDKWFVCPRVQPDAQSRIFRFPDAGGGPSVFSSWSAQLPDSIESHIIHYPGRGSRYNEAPVRSLIALTSDLSQAIQPLLDKPYTFFGHSLGGLVAFELARRLCQNGLPQPSVIFISACGAPHIPDTQPPIHALPKSEFINSLKRLNGIPNEIINNTEVLDLFLPTVRADLELIERYEHKTDRPLDVPIFALGGLDDHRINRERLEGWADYTSAGFRSTYFPGDHFFINTDRDSVIASIVGEIDTLTNGS